MNLSRWLFIIHGETKKIYNPNVRSYGAGGGRGDRLATLITDSDIQLYWCIFYQPSVLLIFWNWFEWSFLELLRAYIQKKKKKYIMFSKVFSFGALFKFVIYARYIYLVYSYCYWFSYIKFYAFFFFFGRTCEFIIALKMWKKWRTWTRIKIIVNHIEIYVNPNRKKLPFNSKNAYIKCSVTIRTITLKGQNTGFHFINDKSFHDY